jgi:hypothetical protein
VTVRPTGRGVLLVVLLAAVLSSCGKKGPPLAPLPRVPATPAGVRALRVGTDVYISFTVPSANASGQSPADMSAVDLYAFTGVRPPSGPDPTKIYMKVASYPVHPAAPRSADTPEGLPAVPAPPGFVQGLTAVVRESLVPEVRVPTPTPPPTAGEADAAAESAAPAALMAPSLTEALQRFYFVVAAGTRGRSSAPSNIVSVPLEDRSGPPGPVRVSYTESQMKLEWTPPPDAQLPPPTAEETGLLPSRPLVPPRPPTTFHVFETPAAQGQEDPFAILLPTPISTQPLAATEFVIPGAVQFGQARCFVVRPVDQVGAAALVGRGTPPACVTPVDTFPPAPPKGLEAIGGVGVINLIWEPNAEPDLAGYLVLRGIAPGGTLQALTPAPVREPTYRDGAATPGVRYVYAVVAVDTASPQNVSGQSNRVEEASRN